MIRRRLFLLPNRARRRQMAVALGFSVILLIVMWLRHSADRHMEYKLQMMINKMVQVLQGHITLLRQRLSLGGGSDGRDRTLKDLSNRMSDFSNMLNKLQANLDYEGILKASQRAAELFKYSKDVLDRFDDTLEVSWTEIPGNQPEVHVRGLR